MSALATSADSPSQPLSQQREKLVTLLTHARRSVIAVALYDRLSVRREIVADLRERLQPLHRSVYEVYLSERERNPMDLIRALRTEPCDVICLFDLERALPDALGYLDLQRESFVELGISLVLWLTTFEHRELANDAPNFYALRTSVFDFTTPAAAEPLATERSFIGRETERALLTSHLQAGGCVVLSGMGGVGKTALAHTVAESETIRSHFIGGTVWIGCETKPLIGDIILAAAVTILGDIAHQLRPAEQRRRLDNVLRDRPCLLILDNFEDVAQDIEVLRWLKALHGPSSALIVSRQTVPYLRARVLSLGKLPSEDAVRLFVERARATGWQGSDENPAITDLCGLVGNLPLAIELLAPLAAELPPAVLADMIRRSVAQFADDGNQTHYERGSVITETFHILLERLSEDARKILVRLSVLPDGVEEGMIASLTGVTDWRRPVAECIDRSLLEFDGTRYRLHPLLRRFAFAQLLEGVFSGEADQIVDHGGTAIGVDSPPKHIVVFIEHKELDSYLVPTVRRKLLEALAASEPDLWIDMSRVEYIDSTGYGMLVGIANKAIAIGGNVHLMNLNEQILNLVMLAGGHRVFDIVTSPISTPENGVGNDTKPSS